MKGEIHVWILIFKCLFSIFKVKIEENEMHVHHLILFTIYKKKTVQTAKKIGTIKGDGAVNVTTFSKLFATSKNEKSGRLVTLLQTCSR